MKNDKLEAEELTKKTDEVEMRMDICETKLGV